MSQQYTPSYMDINCPPNTYINIYEDQTDTPLVLFIIYCFFILCLIISVKTYKEKPPSGLSMGSYSLMSMSSAIIIILVGTISIYAEWAVMFTCVLVVMFFMITVLDPDIFTFARTSII